MHYGGSKDECRRFNKPYMIIKSTGDQIPDNKQLSPIDIKLLKLLYAPPPGQAPPSTTRNRFKCNRLRESRVQTELPFQSWIRTCFLVP